MTTPFSRIEAVVEALQKVATLVRVLPPDGGFLYPPDSDPSRIANEALSSLGTAVEDVKELVKLAEEVDGVVDSMLHEAWPPVRLAPRLSRLQGVARISLANFKEGER